MSASHTSKHPRKDLKRQDIGDFKPERIDLSWDIAEHLLHDNFFLHHYASLTSYIKNFVEHVFKPGGSPIQGSVWPSAGENNIHLESIVSEIARPDPYDQNPWDDLMKCRAKRSCVMRAVLMRIFTDQVFSQLLFGADQKQKEMLHHQDKQFMKDDGFRRTKMRSTTVQMMLGHTYGIPPCFWSEVDKLALKVLILVLPVLNWTRKTWPSGEELIDVKDVYQSIHSCVAYAAWFAVQARRSPSMLKFTWLSPGDRYLPDQIELCEKLYQSRRKIVEREYDEALSSRISVSAGSAPPGLPPNRVARVMISVVPRLEKLDITVAPDIGAAVGHTVNTLADHRVVYYHGLQGESDDQLLFRSSLAEHSLSLRPRRLFSPGAFLRGSRRHAFRYMMFVAEILCYCFVVVCILQFLRETGETTTKTFPPKEKNSDSDVRTSPAQFWAFPS
ncbi:hypothetical protein CkaCkLH20_06717 [Colletotrichum karsti]|uniref:Uncharacterized protein n=1 Tax=Colletotrichum karsti TaxID=1095194 RepID=A0A9P6IBV5_9PEZI|nr:uncharacterized protein CkaCkLH20_06717 [Colletotrichum karsti]KAF9875785.1 hypothetical protein CkaCkLH20_06717 [Colletotrichum karsti]